MIGIVGRSGSGKSTLTKLIQRLHAPEQDRVLVDGIDISLIDAAQLRRQVGVVLQENLLFNRSVRENIAIVDPAAPIEAVMQAAQLAGADEFISELPEGYDTRDRRAGRQPVAAGSASASPSPARCSPTRAASADAKRSLEQRKADGSSRRHGGA